METDDLFRLALALAIGLLAGLERGWQRREDPEGSRVAGLRTFGLIGLLGGVCGLLSRSAGALVLPAGLLGLAALLARGYAASAGRDHDLSVTSETAALLTFALGACAVAGFGK